MAEKEVVWNEAQEKAIWAANQKFITTVRIISDASPREAIASGWGQKGKLAWLAKTVADHRAEIRKILGD